MTDAREVLELDDLSPYLLLQNGNFLYKVPFRGGWAVLKVYYGSRGFFSRIVKSLENVLLAGQTSYMPKARLRTEIACIEIWRKHGFRVFETYPDVEVRAPGCPPGGYLLMEYVEAEKIIARLARTDVPLDEKRALYRRFLVDWGRRHEIAIREREPRLVHENGDGKHVMLVGDDFLWFDFEMIYRSRAKIRDHVSHEIVQYLWHTLKTVPPDLADVLLQDTIDHYPDRARLERAYDYFFRHPNPFHRAGRALDRRFYKRSQKPSSKYNVVRRLKAQLDAS